MDPSEPARRRRYGWLDWAVRFRPSAGEQAGPSATLPMSGLGRPVSLAARAIPVVMVVVGIAVAVPSAVWAERPSGEGLGSFGVEVGAAVWFAGAVTLGVRRATTVRRALLILLTALLGAVLVVIALVLDWSGAALTLAMEFGVGALAVLVIDVIVVGRLQPGLERIARDAETASVEVRLRRSWMPVELRIDHDSRSSA